MHGDVLDVAIGVVFVWFLLSVVLSAVNEGLALLTHVRAKHLWLGVGRLLDPAQSPLPRRFVDAAVHLPFGSRDDLRPSATDSGAAAVQERPWTEVVGWFTSRPSRKDPQLQDMRQRTQALYDELAPQLIEIAKSGRLSKVTHLAGEAVADAVVSLARNVHPGDLLAAAVELRWDQPSRNALRALLAPVPDDARLDSDQLVELGGAPGSAALDEDRLRELYMAATKRLTVRDVSDYFRDNPELAKAVRRAVAAVGLDERTAAVKKVVEDAFDRGMEQMTRFYRRQNRKIMLVVAVPLVLVVQANSIAIARNLWHDQNLRAATASAAAGEASNAALLKGCEPTEGDERPPIEQARDQFDCAADVIGRATQFRVGFALDELRSAHGAAGADAELELADIVPFFTKDFSWLGRLLTLAALVFGAQFWFDVLRRMVGLRKMLPGRGPPLTT